MPASVSVSSSTLTLRELDARLGDFFLGEYHQRVHGKTGARPQEHWEARGFLPRLPDSLEQLDLLLLTVAKARRIQQDDIRFEGFRYLDVTLAAYVGETGTIRYDPRDLAEIRDYYQDRFLCRAICQQLAGQTISLKDIVRARTQRRRQVQAGLSARAQIVETLLAEPSSSEQPPSASPLPVTPRLKRFRND